MPPRVKNPSAYNIYQKEQHAKLKQQDEYKGKSFQEMNVIIAGEWKKKTPDEKLKYKPIKPVIDVEIVKDPVEVVKKEKKVKVKKNVVVPVVEPEPVVEPVPVEKKEKKKRTSVEKVKKKPDKIPSPPTSPLPSVSSSDGLPSEIDTNSDDDQVLTSTSEVSSDEVVEMDDDVDSDSDSDDQAEVFVPPVKSRGGRGRSLKQHARPRQQQVKVQVNSYTAPASRFF